MGEDALGDRMKEYERAMAGQKAMPFLPILARIDGRAFSSFTKGLGRPFDSRMQKMMQLTTEFLVKETNAVIGYCQSDEISLCLYTDDYKSQVYFDGRLSKLTSQLAAMASVHFYQRTLDMLPPDYALRRPSFDCRVWNVPNKDEAANYFLWREIDATKNSISMAARSVYSHMALHNKTSSEMQELLHKVGINWSEYPAAFKRGVYIQRRKTSTPFTAAELDDLPPMHHARTNPDLVVERSTWEVIDMPPFGRVINRPAVIFDGAPPAVSTEIKVKILSADGSLV